MSVVIVLHLSEITRFSNVEFSDLVRIAVLHLSEITRFSNVYFIIRVINNVLHLSEITRFSNAPANPTGRLNGFTLI